MKRLIAHLSVEVIDVRLVAGLEKILTLDLVYELSLEHITRIESEESRA